MGLMNCWMEIVIEELCVGELCCKLIMGWIVFGKC